MLNGLFDLALLLKTYSWFLFVDGLRPKREDLEDFCSGSRGDEELEGNIFLGEEDLKRCDIEE